jgi:aspartyl-tRNA(Asn)/glutamyl-tRNA(Gln) amidotransferase subunit A
MTTAAEICRMDAVSLAAHVRARRLSPVEVIDAVLDRLERLEPVLHAFCVSASETARRDARAQEARLMAGDEIGPLAGVPVSI